MWERILLTSIEKRKSARRSYGGSEGKNKVALIAPALPSLGCSSATLSTTSARDLEIHYMSH
jgi:hypothetical protein